MGIIFSKQKFSEGRLIQNFPKDCGKIGKTVHEMLAEIHSGEKKHILLL